MTSGANRLGWCTFVFCTAMTTVSAQQHHSYVADAKREYAAVFSQPEKPCATAEDEANYKRCIGKVVELTDAHLTKLFIAIRGIASQDDADATMKSRLPLLDNADAAGGNIARICAIFGRPEWRVEAGRALQQMSACTNWIERMRSNSRTRRTSRY